jgi:hypothetical protein
MNDTRPDWLRFSTPGLGLSFRYPGAAADGEPVEMDDFRAHFRTMDSAQVYFEVSRHTGVSAGELYRRETAAIRRANPDVRVSDAVSVSFAGCDAQQFTVTFPDKERIFTLIEREGRVYRVIYDPRSPVNHEIIGTVTFE